MKRIAIAILSLGTIAALAVMMLPLLLQSLGLHPNYPSKSFDLTGQTALIITTSHGVLNPPGETDGEPTGVFSSEMTIPYYEFIDAGMTVDIASIQGGPVPIDPSSFRPAIKTPSDSRFLADPVFQDKVAQSLPIEAINIADYDLFFIAGGWGAAYDLGDSPALGELISQAYQAEHTPLFGAVCHGPLGFIQARAADGSALLKGRRLTGVTNKQVEELGIVMTPRHPETELKRVGARYESRTAFRDIFANHVVIDDEQRFVTGQNQNAGHETAQKLMAILEARTGE
ncbi:type 1 glutamine amidotransferase domain-containing protein [Ferrimonas pelagia]|uniref:type 1 glutamine amidotransferase domain-containing protein n=1 Tax=Ferrimonas pelagia TaxID=1177826 RepID=UPI0031F0EF1E